MRLLVTTILFWGILSASGQIVIRSEINQVVDTIAFDNQYKSSGVGYGGIRTSQWDRFLILKKEATNEELRLLTSHKNPVVRCYSFQALAERNDNMTFPILLKHLTDNARVRTFIGCIISETAVGDFFVSVATSEYMGNGAFELSNVEQQTLDSLLLFDPKIKLTARSWLLRDLKPKEQFHQRLRQLAKFGKEPNAIIALARFQHADDIDVVRASFKKKKNEYYAIYAAREFPNINFYPELLKIFEREWKEKYYDYSKWRILYQALAKYDNAQTLELFERTITEKDGFKRETLGKYLLMAITKFPSKNFEELIPRIKLSDNQMSRIKSETNIEK